MFCSMPHSSSTRYVKKMRITAFLAFISTISFACAAFAALDNTAWQEGLSHLRAQNWESAIRTAESSEDDLLQDYVAWKYYLNDSSAPQFEDVADFMRRNPDFPGQRSLQSKAEYSMPGEWGDGAVIAWFGRHPPVGLEGKRRLGFALLSQNKPKEAQNWIQEYWHKASLSTPAQNEYLKQYKKFLTPEDHMWRIYFMSEGKNYSAASALGKKLGKSYWNFAECMTAFFKGKSNAASLASKLPENFQRHPATVLKLTTYYRKKEHNKTASSQLRLQPKNTKYLEQDFWKEREVVIRRHLRQKSAQQAYSLAKAHQLTPDSGIEYYEAEFLAGWISLRWLKDPDGAIKHFETLNEESRHALLIARGKYWLARSYEALKKKQMAEQFYQQASAFPTVFYGQLARKKQADSGAFRLPEPPAISESTKQEFQNRNSVRLLRVLHQLGQDEDAESFAASLQASLKNPAEHFLLAQNLSKMGRIDLAVLHSKLARKNNVDLTEFGYPLSAPMPKTRPPVEDALIYAVIRQESGFKDGAQSHAGAMGLMQIMPATAHSVAKKHGINFSKKLLLNDNKYNVEIGNLLLTQKVSSYDNAYALALAAYNAGPGRVREWLNDFGDPRTGKVDLIDWIESIPYTETRNYVHRVLENLVVYRFLLASDSQERKLAENGHD